jgi:hypothetical protein
MPIQQNFNQMTVRVTNIPTLHSTKERRPQQKHANRIDVPDPETQPQPKRKNNQSNTK